MAERRRQYYTDQKIQGYLLAVLVGLQLLLVSLMLFYLYAQINTIIDENLYRVHPRDDGAWPDLFRALITVMLVFVAVNIPLLYLAHGYWSRYIRKTVGYFSTVLDKMLVLDFSGLAHSLKRRHPLAALVELWFEKEKARSHRIQRLLDELASYQQDAASEEDLEQVQKRLQEYRRLLKAG